MESEELNSFTSHIKNLFPSVSYILVLRSYAILSFTSMHLNYKVIEK